jgi:protein-export membrane protein SecD
MSESTEVAAGTQSFIRFFRAFGVLAFMGWLAYVVYSPIIDTTSSHSFKLGLDLAGGSHLVYEADVSKIDPAEVNELMNVLRNVIEGRVNRLGVEENVVYVEQSSFVTDTPVERLVVELPGVSDVSEAVAEIGSTPLLEFKLYDAELDAQQQAVSQSLNSLAESATSSGAVIGDVRINGETVSEEPPFVDTGLTGRFFERAEAVLPQNTQGSGFATSPFLNITFTAEGGELFADITRANVGRQLGIFLDGELLSAPTINEAITGGRAVVSGSFTPDEVQALAQNLNFGALPVPIELQSTQTIGASLGGEVLQKGIAAGAIGFSLVVAFMLLWYRLPGLVAGVALISYVTIMLALFQYIPVTLTAAGLAGFILSLGMAVDANVLVFERMKEEYRAGAGSRDAATVGFARAWSAIRDGNITSLLSAIILFWFGTSLVKGFALVFGLGVIVSMFSALVITRTLLVTLPDVRFQDKTLWSFLLGNGLNKQK